MIFLPHPCFISEDLKYDTRIYYKPTGMRTHLHQFSVFFLIIPAGIIKTIGVNVSKRLLLYIYSICIPLPLVSVQTQLFTIILFYSNNIAYLALLPSAESRK